MGWADVVLVEDVNDYRSWATYASQTAGIPYPTQKSIAETRKEVNKLFEMYPNLTWRGMCQLPLWAKHKRKRFATAAQLVRSYNYAFQDGFMPELEMDYAHKLMDQKIAAALLVETSPEWRRRLMAARGPQRETTYEAWSHRVDL